jgi:hypothetical protein
MMWRPLLGFAGVGFVACFTAAAVLYGSGAGTTVEEIAAFYASQSDRARQIAGFAVMLVALVALLIFVAELHKALHGPGLMLVSGTVTGCLLIAANALWAASAFTVELEPGYVIDPRSHLLVEDAGFVLFVSSAVAAIPLVAATSVAILRRRLARRWFGWAGVPVSAALAVSYWFEAYLAFLAWVAGAAILIGLEHES